jgi:hypothetical protein
LAMKGTAGVGIATAASFAAPRSSVITGIGNIAGPATTLRENGTQRNTSAATLGTGNFGNYALYLFRRGGTSLPYNGRCYGLIVRGAESNATQIVSGESFLKEKMKVVF